MLPDELIICQSLLNDHLCHSQCQGCIGAGRGLRRMSALSAVGVRRRVDDHHLCSALPGLFNVDHFLHVGLGGVLAPQHYQAGIGQIPWDIVLHTRQKVSLVASRPAGQQRLP